MGMRPDSARNMSGNFHGSAGGDWQPGGEWQPLEHRGSLWSIVPSQQDANITAGYQNDGFGQRRMSSSHYELSGAPAPAQGFAERRGSMETSGPGPVQGVPHSGEQVGVVG